MTGRAHGAAEIRRAVLAQRSTAEALFDALAEGSPGHPGIMRDTYGPGEDFAHRLFRAHVAREGLAVSTDHAGNSFATWRGADPDTPAIILGSHLDSVPHGGNFDGAAGVLAGFTVIAALKALGVQPRCDVTVMAIRAEESVWFQVSYIGSRSALGSLPDGALEARRVDTGRTLAEHMAASGGDPEAVRRRQRSLDPARIRAFLELHIEQAPALVETGMPVAVGSGIPGNVRYPAATILGRHDHVGTPRRFRRDAAMAGADLAMAVDRLWQAREAAGVPMAATFGRFHTDPAVHGLTIVPGRFDFSVDIRAYDAAVLAELEREFLGAVDEIAARRHVTIDLGRRAAAAVGLVDPAIAASLTAHAQDHGIPTMALGSPASHDAAAFAEAGVPMAMVFVRNENGSHNPEEQMTIEDFLDGCSLLASWVADHVG